jgi:predicted house-cleaning noncanonical NTP pyrophosphatase (MazG superfamily)
MNRTIYNKLIHDRILEIIRPDGKQPILVSDKPGVSDEVSTITTYWNLQTLP